MATTTITIQAQVDADVEKRAIAVLQREGLSLNEAMTQVLTATAASGTWPLLRGTELKWGNGAGGAEYDRWFHGEIQEALEDESPGILHEVVMRKWQEQRAELLSRLADEDAA